MATNIVRAVLPNMPSVVMVRVPTTAAYPAGAIQFPKYLVPDGYTVLIGGWVANTNIIYVGISQTHVQAPGLDFVWPLLPGQFVALGVQSTDIFWVTSIVAGESAVFIVEQGPSVLEGT